MKLSVLKRTKLWLTSAMFVGMSACLAVGFGSMNRWSAKADETATETPTVTVDLTMGAGGSIRYDGGTLGLGFLTQIDYDDYNALTEDYDVKTGTIFVRKNDAKTAGIEQLNDGNFTMEYFDGTVNATTEKLIYKDVVNNGWMNADTAENDGHYEYRGSVVNMKQLNVEKDYCARGYVAYKAKNSTDDDDWTYIYTPYVEADHCRSIETIAIAALKDTATEADEDWDATKYKYEVSEGSGVYSPFNSTAREQIAAYTPRTIDNGVIFSGDSLDYLYYADNSSVTEYTQCAEGADWTPATVMNSTALTEAGLTLGSYTGSAVEISNFSKTMRAYIKLPSRYDFAIDDTTSYNKIGVWFAVSHDGSAATTDTVKIVGSDSYVANGTDIIIDSDKLGVFQYVEFDLPVAGGKYWADGYLRLLHLDITTATRSAYKVYVGAVTCKKVDVSEEIEIDELLSTTGLTSTNWTRFTMQDRPNDKTSTVNNETIANAIFNEETTLNGEGGYTGASISYIVKSAKYYDLAFPTGIDYLTTDGSATGKYFTIWIAVQSGESMQGSMSLYTGNVDYVFTADNIAHVTNNESLEDGADLRWNSDNSGGFEANKWYQLYIPLEEIVNANTEGSIRLFRWYADSTAEANNRLLIGNIGVTDTLPNTAE